MRLRLISHSLVAGVAILSLFTPERAQAALLTINVQDCRESIGIHTVPRSDVVAHLPTDFSTRFGFGGFGSAPGADPAQLMARTMRCAIATVAGSQLDSSQPVAMDVPLGGAFVYGPDALGLVTPVACLLPSPNNPTSLKTHGGWRRQ